MIHSKIETLPLLLWEGRIELSRSLKCSKAGGLLFVPEDLVDPTHTPHIPTTNALPTLTLTHPKLLV